PNLVDCGSEFSKMIEKKAIAVGLKLLRAKVRHLGTDENLKILKAISDYLATRVEMRFKTKVDDILVKDNKVYGVKVGEDEILADKVILCVGRDGATWLDEVFRKHNIPTINNKVDVGVRVETNNIIMEDINENLYEGKFIYNTSVGTQVRTFCSNPKGQVVVENEAGTIIANGHSYKDDKLSSENTNFALLVSHTFSEPFNEPNKYAHSVSKLANQLSCGSVIVQRYGDIKLGRRTTDQRIQEGFVKPTLKEAVPGDLGLILPYNTMKSIIEMIEALDHITPGIANEHTLLYGVEAKFYSSRPVVDNKLEVKNIKNLYVGGDGAGITRGLAQASASGVYIARNIVKGGK
ncbi:MAG: FAD-dependent oxidoreductase, partial [Bacilli bacterium]|nr:FAD-dependent oxidoreductase [Bacilli bacterium]